MATNLLTQMMHFQKTFVINYWTALVTRSVVPNWRGLKCKHSNMLILVPNIDIFSEILWISLHSPADAYKRGGRDATHFIVTVNSNVMCHYHNLLFNPRLLIPAIKPLSHSHGLSEGNHVFVILESDTDIWGFNRFHYSPARISWLIHMYGGHFSQLFFNFHGSVYLKRSYW